MMSLILAIPFIVIVASLVGWIHGMFRDATKAKTPALDEMQRRAGRIF